jgi:hypothetical protein
MKRVNKIIKELQNSPIYPLRQKISELKRKLSESDYKAIKYAEGLISEADYAPIKAEREGYRAEINSLEAQIAEIKKNA